MAKQQSFADKATKAAAQPGKKCPKCGFPLMVKKVYKREGEFLKCPKEECGYKEGCKEKP